MIISKNVIYKLKINFPELLEQIEEFKNNDDALLLHNFFLFVFNPFFKEALFMKPNDITLIKRIFEFIEEMAQSSDFEIKNILGVTVLESLSPSQLELAKKYMRPQTKKMLVELENYLKALFKR